MTKRRSVRILGLAAILACVAAIFVPSGWWVAYGSSGVESVWSISKLAAVISLAISVAIASVPLLSSAAWRWRVPGGFGLLVIAACVAMAVHCFYAYSHGNAGFHPIGIVVAAVAGALLLAEGLLARPRHA